LLDEVCRRTGFPKAEIDDARRSMMFRHQELSDGVWEGLFGHYTGLIMGMTAENVAEKYHASRKVQNEFAVTSQMRAKTAPEENRFNEEIVPVVIPGRKGKPDVVVDSDEHPRPNTPPLKN
jgi:acetyl-CoA C-acetyltransferase